MYTYIYKWYIVWINGIIMPWISPPVSSNMGWFMYLLMAWLPLMNWTEHCFFIVQMKHGRDWNDRIRKRTFAQSSRWNAFGWSSSGNRFSCWQTMFWKSTGHISIPKNASTINKSPWDSTVQEKIGRGRLVLKAMETEIHKPSHIIMHHHKPSCISYQKSS